MKTNITSNSMKLLLSDTFVCADATSPIHINVDFRPEYNLDCELIFEFSNKKDSNDDKQKMDIKMDSSNRKITFSFSNTSNPFGVGNLHPLPIATLKGKQAYMNFRFSRPEENMPYLFTYSIFVEEVVNK